MVTHLAQVAAYADRHLVVRKRADGQVTRSDVALLEGEDRLAELARMLGGVSDSKVAREHARELLDGAHPDTEQAALRATKPVTKSAAPRAATRARQRPRPNNVG